VAFLTEEALLPQKWCPATACQALDCHPMTKLALTCLALALTACASDVPRQTVTQAGEAVVMPLNDLNLVRSDIPAPLQAAQRAPYAVPVPADCPALTAEVHALDAVLGPDLDAPASTSNPSLIERGAGTASGIAVGNLRSAAENVVPFRGWVRKLSGAERYSRDVAAAITAGGARRAFLKGMAAGASCVIPASTPSAS